MDAAELACASLFVMIRGRVFNIFLVLAEIGDPGLASSVDGNIASCNCELVPSFPRPRVQDVKPHTSTFMSPRTATHWKSSATRLRCHKTMRTAWTRLAFHMEQ